MKLLITLMGLCISNALMAQIKIGDNPQNINANSVLELESTDRVFVISRMSEQQMNSIVPLQGAMVYNNDAQCIFYYDGAQWINLCDSLQLQFTTDPIVNPMSTIVITENGDIVNFEVGEIGSENIIDFSINSNDIQNNSINDDKLAPDSVGAEELQDNTVTDAEIDYNLVTLSDFTNDAGYITGTNIVSANPNNVITDLGGAFYDNSPILNDIAVLEANDMDTDDTNELQRLQDVMTLDPSANNERIINLQDPTNAQDAATKSYVDTEIANAVTGGGIASQFDQVTIVGTGIAPNLFEVQNISGDRIIDGTIMGVDIGPLTIQEGNLMPGGANQILQTNAAGTAVNWVPPPTGGGSTEVADGTTISGIGTVGDPFTITPGTNGQVLTTVGTVVQWQAPAGGGTDDQTAAEVTVAGTPTNYTPTSGFVQGHLEGIDAALAGGGGTPNLQAVLAQGNDANTLGITNLTTNAADGTAAANVAFVNAAVTAGGSLTNGNILVGDVANTPQEQQISGDATMTNAGVLTIANDAITTVKILDDNVTTAKIAPAATDTHVLTTIETSPGVFDVQWAAGASGGALTDGFIRIGDVANTPQEQQISGDATITNTGVLTIANDAITTVKILDDNVTTAKIAPAATDTHVLTTIETSPGVFDVQWAAGASGGALTDGFIRIGDAANTPQEQQISGDATITNTGVLTVANDAITTVKILDDNVTTAKIAPAATDTHVLTTIETSPGVFDVQWAASSGHFGAAEGGIFFADIAANAFAPIENAFSLRWDAAKRGNTGQLLIGADGGPENDDVKVHIMEALNGDVAYPLLLQNLAGGAANATAVGVLFGVDDTDSFGKGALIYERKDNAGRGDFHFLQDPAGDNQNPIINPGAYDEAVLTIQNNGEVGIGIVDPLALFHVDGDFRLNEQFIDETGSAGNPGDVLTSTATGTAWAAGGGGGEVNDGVNIGTAGVGPFISKNGVNLQFKNINAASNKITVIDDVVDNEIDIDINEASLSIDADQVDLNPAIDVDGDLTDETNVQEAIADLAALGSGSNLSNTNLTQTAADRTYDLNNGNLRFIGTGNLRMGSSAGAINNKLHVEGTIRAEGIRNTFGTLPANVAYSFDNDSNTGMYRADVDQLGLVVGGTEALRIDDNQNVGAGTTTPNSTLETGGSFATSIQTTTGATTLDAGDHTVILGGNHNITLPGAGSCQGRIYVIKNPTANTPTISNYLDNTGAGSTAIPANDFIWLQSDGANWQQIR